MSDINPKTEPFADDILDGVAAFSEFIGWPPRRVYYMLERGQLPGGKIGNRWIGSKRVRRQRLESLAGEQIA